MLRLVVLALVLGLASAQASSNCTDADIGHTYLPCDLTTNTRTGVYFYTRACNPTSPLPSPLSGLPCNIQCDAGYYLPFGSTACQSCQPGSYSLGGADLYTSWATIPTLFRTSCTGANCQPWIAAGNYVSSNNQTSNNIDSSLYLVAQFVRNSGNFIQFTFTVDAENCGSTSSCDGIQFYIDGTLTMPLVSTSLTWQTVKFPVTPGTHEFRWNYHKDFSVTFGQDTAAIQSIEVFGTGLFSETCAACPHGTFSSSPSSTQCTQCDYNTFASSPGSISCTACATNQFAFVGSSTCSGYPPCTARDYFLQNPQCNSATNTYNQTLQVAYLVPGKIIACDPTLPGATPPVPGTNLPCTCSKGLILNNGNCVPCPDGSASVTGTCQTCPVGTSATKILEISDWSYLPSIFTSMCAGDCDPYGWTPRGPSIHSGYVFGFSMDSYINTVQTFPTDQGNIQFGLRLAVSGVYFYRRDVFVQFSVSNDTDGQLFSRNYRLNWSAIGGLASTNETFNITDAGTYNVTWRFHVGDGSGFDRNTFAELSWVRFTGVDPGSAFTCVPCPAGFGANNPGSLICDRCQPGFYSNTTGMSCTSVPDGYFTNSVAATSYLKCGPGTTSNADHTDCVTNCTVTAIAPAPASNPNRSTTYNYDLSSLYNPTLMYFAGIDVNYNSYFLNICQRGSSNVTCFTQDGTPIPSFACQTVKGWGFSVDIGSTIGFTVNQDPTTGLLVTFDYGTPGCTFLYGTPTPRRTVVNFICDLTAGAGSPVPMYNGSLVEYPSRSCIYSFNWRSKLACPICTDADFTFEELPCISGSHEFAVKKLIDCVGDPSPTIIPAAIPCYTCPQDANNFACSNHGSCDDRSGLCNCASNWAGDACSQCAVGYYGPTCTGVCPGGVSNACNAHGRCDSGLAGKGTCACTNGWAGTACDVCDEGFEGNDCEALPATVTDVIPVWVIIVIIGAVLILIGAAILLYRAKRQVEHKYSRLLSTQPIELTDDAPGPDNMVGLPEDEDRDEPK